MISEKEIIMIHKICKVCSIYDYSINPDGSIDVNGDIDFNHLHLHQLPLRFNYVDGNFNCSSNYLTSLKDCPRHITGYFDCSRNILTSLEGGPKTIGNGFDCSYNHKLTSLEGGPVVNKSYYYYCQIESLVSLDGFLGNYNQLVCYNKNNLVKKHNRKNNLKILEKL